VSSGSGTYTGERGTLQVNNEIESTLTFDGYTFPAQLDATYWEYFLEYQNRLYKVTFDPWVAESYTTVYDITTNTVRQLLEAVWCTNTISGTTFIYLGRP
jgi:hypothetical protein